MDAVLNWIWQGSIVAIAAAAALRALDPARAAVRYRTLWVVLVAILLLPVAPLVRAALASEFAYTARRGGPVIPLPDGWWLSSAVAIAMAAVWVVIGGIRLGRAASAMRRARHMCRPLDSALESRLRCWSRVRTRGRRARLVVSDAVSSAAVLGGGAPLIAVAPSVLDSLTDDELDRIVIHEWAHVQRRDDLTHLFQAVVQTLVGWHPAVRWCDARLHLEREIACDEMAVGLTGSAKAYAACLTRLATLAASPPPLHAVGALSGSTLHRRVVRVLSPRRTRARGLAPAAATGASTLLAALALLVGGYEVIGATPAAGNAAGALVQAYESIADDLSGPRQSGAVVVDERPSEGGRQASRASVAAVTTSDEPSVSPAEPLPAQDLSAPPPAPSTGEPVPLASRPAAMTVTPAPTTTAMATSVLPAAQAASARENKSSRWGAAADAGVAIGDSAQDAALATAGFFNRLGRNIADSF